METFDDILTSVLKSVEDNPSANVEEVIAAKMAEMGLSDEGEKLLAETNAHLDSFEEAYQSLKAAKKQGETRTQWLQEEIYKIGQKNHLTEEQTEQLIQDIATQATESIIDTTLNAEKESL